VRRRSADTVRLGKQIVCVRERPFLPPTAAALRSHCVIGFGQRA
jgi:hypothetical protein